MKPTFSRQDYINGKVTHEQYYDQFVSDTVVNLLFHLREDIKKSRHERFNDISLHRWDAIADSNKGYFVVDGKYSLAAAVCILKQAARQIRGF